MSTPSSLPPQLKADAERYLMPTYKRYAVAFVRGEGARLWDAAGVEYLDLFAGIGVCNVGHCHPRVVAAVREQVGRLIHASNLFYNPPQVALARLLSSRSLGGKVFFCNSGAEATEAALKLARRHRPRGEIVVLERAFHGRTLGALSATPQPEKQRPFEPLVPGFRVVPCDPAAVFDAVGPDTAAVLLEPVQGEGGVWPLGKELLAAAREACDRHGALLVFDEVQCGMGRTGTLWAFEGLGVRPDLLTTAKGLGGGLAIGAVVASPRYSDLFQVGDHGSTFGGSPLACAAALAALEVASDGRLLERVKRVAKVFQEGLAAVPGVKEVRGLGLMVGAEIDGDAPAVVERALYEERLVINAPRPTTLRFLPPLVVEEAEVQEGLARLQRVLGG
jgi:acetylornithine/N-succinyldiaminopimelate aminotransferase